MITRSKLVEQLRDYQIRSQHKWAALIVFSANPQISSRADIIAAVLWALLFTLLAEKVGEKKRKKTALTFVHITSKKTHLVCENPRDLPVLSLGLFLEQGVVHLNYNT